MTYNIKIITFTRLWIHVLNIRSVLFQLRIIAPNWKVSMYLSPVTTMLIHVTLLTTSDDYCYCSAMSAYEMACAKYGVEYKWRASIGVCDPTCPGGFVFSDCADQDERACEALNKGRAYAESFTSFCVGGRVCADGLYFDMHAECVAMSLSRRQRILFARRSPIHHRR